LTLDLTLLRGQELADVACGVLVAALVTPLEVSFDESAVFLVALAFHAGPATLPVVDLHWFPVAVLPVTVPLLVIQTCNIAWFQMH
jgi:hypothetical protein